MSASSTVSVVPDYNSTSQFVSIETYTTEIDNINTSLGLLDANLITTSAQSAEALKNSNDALSQIPFGINKDLASPYTITSTMSTFLSLPFTTTTANSKMRFFINVNVQDLGSGSGSTVNIQIKVNTATPQTSQIYITDIVKDHNQILSLFFTATGDETAGSLTVEIDIQKTAGSAIVNRAELLGLINV